MRKHCNDRNFCCLAALLFIGAALTLLTDFTDVQRSETINSARVTAGLHRPLPTGNCSCFNSMASWECCERVARRSHKMGHILSLKLFHPYSGINLAVLGTSRSEPPPHDYRDVIISRNIYHSLVSGYLYHKTGRECWLDADGNSYLGGVYPDVLSYDWERLIKTTTVDPPKNNRSLCQYLAEESEKDGLRMIIDLSFEKWYNAVIDSYDYALSAGSNDNNRTLFLCYEDLAADETQNSTLHQALAFLYPEGVPANFQSQRAALVQKPAQPHRRLGSYNGGHSTSHDPDLRERLTQLVKTLDVEVFDRKVASAQRKVKCGDTGRNEDGA